MKHFSRRGITIAEILIGVALIGILFVPIAGSLFNTTKKIHVMNFEVIAETLAKSILDELLKKVPFDHVDPKRLTIGDSDGDDIKLDIADSYKYVEFQGNKSGSTISIDDADYKWEIETTDLDGHAIKVSCWRAERQGYSDKEKQADGDSLKKKALIKNFDAEEFSKRKRQVLMKTVRFRIWWKLRQTGIDWDPRYKMTLLTRKARLEDIAAYF